ncbi:MAG: hypothetical protein SNH13_02145 [Rikenellaceae bacterium]
MVLRNLVYGFDAVCIEMRKELAQIESIVLNCHLTSTQVGKMGNEFFHLMPNCTIECVINGSEAAFTDVSKRQHVVKDLDTADLFSFLRSDFSVIMAC